MRKLRLLLIAVLVISIVIAVAVLSQEGVTGPYITSSMIEISYDGVTFSDASAMVSGIQIVTGQVTATHVSRARRGDIITWEGQLGTPEEDKKGIWKINTGLIPKVENRFYIRFRFGIRYYDGATDESPISVISDYVQLTGQPKKPVNKGVESSQ